MPTKVTIPLLMVPGLGGSCHDHWQSHWERNYPTAARVEQANWDRPDLATWIDRLTAAVERTPGAVLVGHSLGCVLIAHLARRRPQLPIGGALLVAPADVDLSERLPACVNDFTPTPLVQLPYPAMTVASGNDPYMNMSRARWLADIWGTQFADVGRCGHINVEAGYGPWRSGERLLAGLVQRISAEPTRAAAQNELFA
jgi:predicted alpha/beta hydrolase family esterase